MATINKHYAKLQSGYLFPEIGRRVNAFATSNPGAKIIRMGIGDVVLPLPGSVRSAMIRAVDELGSLEGFKGYGPEQGYKFLRKAICGYYASQNVEIRPEDIFVSDGSKCDSGNIQEIFGLDNIVAVSDPVYPVYVDTNVMAGRTGPANEAGRYTGLVYMPSTNENGFEPALPQTHVDLIYLCSPNNPTGAVMSRESLQQWVDYASAENAVILFDAAYEAFIRQKGLVHSIFEIPGAREVAVEFRSFSKQAGFTGIRCGYTVMHDSLTATGTAGRALPVKQLWSRRHATRFNGVSYPVQRGAEAVFSETGRKETGETIDFYMQNAAIIRKGLEEAGYHVFGGDNAPYIWVETPGGKDSWEFFDKMLNEAQIVVTPGSGFGACGQGYFRISAFALRENVEEAMERIRTKVLF